MNPWPIIGGVATSILSSADFIRYLPRRPLRSFRLVTYPSRFRSPENAVAGDTVILTKPLGTQLVVNLHQWYHKWRRFGTPNRWDDVKSIVTPDDGMYALSLSLSLSLSLGWLVGRSF